MKVDNQLLEDIYWDGSNTLIDFPQAINPVQNPNPYPIFKRDVNRICEYCQKQGIENNHDEMAEWLWTSQGYSTVLNFLRVEDNES